MNLREHFALPDPPDTVELRAFTHGLMPKTVPTMMARFTTDWRERGVDAWNEVPNHWRPDSGDAVGWWTLPEYLGDHFVAPLLGAPAGTCMLQPNVHWTVQCILSAPELVDGGRRTVVVTENEFPSVLHSVEQWQDLLDLDLHIVPATADGFVDQEAVLDAIRPDTALVALSHVGFTTGERLPDAFLRYAANAVHDAGGLFLLDGYHSAASMPIDVDVLGVDLFVGGLLKEASGSSGNSFVYVRDGLELTPRLTGWFGDANPFGFAKEPMPHPDVRRRFMGGTTAVASMYHAVEGVRLLLDAGLDAVRQHSLDLTAQAINRADAADIPLRSPRASERRAAMVILEVPNAHRLCEHLKQHDIYTDSRQNRYLRMAPFVWNTQEELDRAFDRIVKAISSGSYRTDAPSIETAGPVT
jgi:kynureninase